MSWAVALAGFMLLIVLHELGHFVVAKAVGMRVERFSLFFPPTLFSVRRGETEYAIGAIPLGGYVKITGMSPEELKLPASAAAVSVMPGAVAAGAAASAGEPEALDPEILRRAYYNQAPWKRIVVILAGPGVNLLIAFALFWGILASNSLNGALTLERLNPSIPTLIPSTSIAAIEKSEPAEGVLHAGDRILAVDGRRASVSEAMAAISSHRCAGALVNGCTAATPVQLTIRRDGKVRTLSIRPRYDSTLKRMLIGFDFGAAVKPVGVFAAGGVALHEMWVSTTSMFTNLGKAFTSAKARGQVRSVIGITEVAHETVVAGAGYALVFAGFISLVLAVLNLLPFLPLDGGHILWSVGEKVRGRRISLAAMYRYSTVGILLLAFLVINGISNDIGHLGG
jgi:regulator of sigma E protease